jgi:hypothetical protein
VSVCGEQGRFGGGAVGPAGDTQAPVAEVVLPGGPTDTIVDITDSLIFTGRVTDETRVDSVHVEVNGLGNFAFNQVLLDSAPTATVTEVAKRFAVALPATATGESLNVTVAGFDGAGNFASTTVRLRIDDPQPPTLSVRQPASGVVVPAGDTLLVVADASDPSSIRSMGARLFFRNALGQPVTITGDSTVYASPVGRQVDTFLVAIPDTLKPGQYPVHAFAEDNSPNPNDTTSADITITVADTTQPFGNFVAPAAGAVVVAGDSVFVVFRAQDLTGVASVRLQGFSQRGDPNLGTDTTVLRYLAKTATFPSQPSDTTISRYLNAVLTDSTPETVTLEALITDVAGNTATVTTTVTIVAGPFVRIDSPANGSVQPVGTAVPVTIVGRDPDNVLVLGFLASGAVTAVDTNTAIAPPLQVLDTATLTLNVPATAALGSVTLTPYARDQLGNSFFGQAITISLSDTVRPTVNILQPATAAFPVALGDSVFVQVQVQDNRGVSQVTFTGASRRGDVDLGTDTVVARFGTKVVSLGTPDTDTTLTRYLLQLASDSTSETVFIAVTATDSSGNSASDTTTVRIVSGPALTLVRPTDGSVTSVGKSVIIEVRASDPQGVRIVGWRASGVLTAQDSVIRSPVAGVLSDTTTFIDTLQIPALTPLGNIVIVPFGEDSTGDPSGTVAGATVTVQSAAGDVTAPAVSFDVASRVEVDDTVTVTASDASGISLVGFVVRTFGASTVVREDSAAFSGNLSDVTQRFQLTLDTISSFPRQVTIEAFAVDSVGNRQTSAAETLTVVAGKTIALPQGGEIGDGIYNPNRNELYLTNTLLNQLEIFQLNDSSFAAPVPIGSRPVGIALWPRDTLGTNADTVIVANSGGTNLSIVDVANRVERRRHRLPNYVVQTVKTQTNAGGGIDIIVTEFDFSDRPFHLGATCGNVTAGACDNVIAVYSTTPTPAQSTPFEGRGYVAWEDVTSDTNYTGHFMWEVGSRGQDTLQLISVRDTAPGVERRDTIVGAGLGILISVTSLAFQESTFVRNSGDFNHALIGEGGLDQGFARALTYDVRPGLRFDTAGTTCTVAGSALKCDGQFDQGVSEGVFVRDFVANRAAPVTSIATNFNGRTNLVRADSIYAFDFTLRQTGLMAVGGQNPGMDFDPDHAFDASTRGTGGFGGNLNPDDRLLFAARPDANIDVFDTFFYQQIATVPIRDPIIGPVRVAKLPSGTKLLVGVTSAGVVVVRLPSVSNPFPSPIRRTATLSGN